MLLGFQPDTRQAIPGYDGLLYIYSVFLIPVLFILLVGVNILGWHHARINYVFIFGEPLVCYIARSSYSLPHRIRLEVKNRPQEVFRSKSLLRHLQAIIVEHHP